ncbi:hypothetical protein NF212_06775 [Parasalinivibrio latis]|uniref:Sec-independent protein translocase subunit TatA/TatB n=1 Tax=Parasalinivibrio latis TaxID=2952610 RepID=UPI0030E43825
MFDLGLEELFIVSLLAFLIIGPKDLPKFFEIFRKISSKLRKLYQFTKGGIAQLEREVSQSDGNQSQPSWENWLPDELRHLPDDFAPGSRSPDYHQQRKSDVEAVRARCAEQRANTANPGADSSEGVGDKRS